MDKNTSRLIWLTGISAGCISFLIDQLVRQLETMLIWPLSEVVINNTIIFLGVIFTVSLLMLFATSSIKQKWQTLYVFLLTIFMMIAMKGIWMLVRSN